MTVAEAEVSGLVVVLAASLLVDTDVDEVPCCVLEGEDVLCGVLEKRELDVMGVLDVEGVVEAGIDVGVEETEVDESEEDGVVEVAAALSVFAPNVRLNPSVIADTTPPSSPSSCRRRTFASNQFACAMAKIIANTDSSRR